MALSRREKNIAKCKLQICSLYSAICNSSKKPLHLDLYLSFPNADGIAADLDARIIRPGAVGQPKSPSVPGASDDPVLQMASAQRISHVRAGVINGEVSASFAKNGNQFIRDPDHTPLALGQLADPAHGMEFSHRDSPLQSSYWTQSMSCPIIF